MSTDAKYTREAMERLNQEEASGQDKDDNTEEIDAEKQDSEMKGQRRP